MSGFVKVKAGFERLIFEMLGGGWRLLRHCFALRLKLFFPLIQLKRPKLAVLRQLVFLAVFICREKIISLRRAANALAQQPPAPSGYMLIINIVAIFSIDVCLQYTHCNFLWKSLLIYGYYAMILSIVEILGEYI